MDFILSGIFLPNLLSKESASYYNLFIQSWNILFSIIRLFYTGTSMFQSIYSTTSVLSWTVLFYYKSLSRHPQLSPFYWRELPCFLTWNFSHKRSQTLFELIPMIRNCTETFFELILMLPLISRDTFWKFIFVKLFNIRDYLFQLSKLVLH